MPRSLTPVLAALLNDLFSGARKKKRWGDVQVLRLAAEEHLCALAVLDAAQLWDRVVTPSEIDEACHRLSEAVRDLEKLRAGPERKKR